VGRGDAKDKASGKPVKTFKVSSPVSSHNDGKDRRKGERELLPRQRRHRLRNAVS
jgi:hypothetical protein